jgi:hypothetical protein
MSSYIDTSYPALMVALLVFVVITYVVSFLIEKYDAEAYKTSSSKYLMISVVMGLIFAIGSLVLYKKKFGRREINHAGFGS